MTRMPSITLRVQRDEYQLAICHGTVTLLRHIAKHALCVWERWWEVNEGIGESHIQRIRQSLLFHLSRDPQSQDQVELSADEAREAEMVLRPLVAPYLGAVKSTAMAAAEAPALVFARDDRGARGRGALGVVYLFDSRGMELRAERAARAKLEVLTIFRAVGSTDKERVRNAVRKRLEQPTTVNVRSRAGFAAIGYDALKRGSDLRRQYCRNRR